MAQDPELVPMLCLMGIKFNLRAKICKDKKATWFEDQKVVHRLSSGNVKHVERQLGCVYTIALTSFS